jgi:hypothetical protein
MYLPRYPVDPEARDMKKMTTVADMFDHSAKTIYPSRRAGDDYRVFGESTRIQQHREA